ncbi:MAG: AMP-binding protein, partial [Segetibacter sp.]|nr:AMP-binding protein [Segetibacter sp.]
EGIVSFLKNKLPEFMIPSVWVELENFPLIANGKIDRKALPHPDAIERDGNQYQAPRNELESKLASIWQHLLEVEQVGIYDNFFELGGHSLLAIQLISAIRKQLEVEVAIGDVFDYPTIELLATKFNNQSGAAAVPVIKIQSRPERIPLSFSQERLWFIDQLEGSVQYHRPEVLRLKGWLDKDALAFALQMIVNRHEVLRTAIREKDGEAFQYIKDKNLWHLSIIDGAKYRNNVQDLQEHIDDLIKQPFDLAKDDMIRAHLITLTEQENILVVTLHHIGSDGWSISILRKELTDLYESYVKDKPTLLQPLELQYADYAIWQREHLQGELLDRKLSYWKNKLNGVASLQLPTDYPRPAVQSTRGALSVFTINKELTSGLQQLSMQHGTTLFMTLLAAFKVLLYRYSGQQDICIGTPTAGRQYHEVEDLIGFFVNMLSLRSEVNGDTTFIELLQQVRTLTLEAYEYQEVPFEKVVEAVVKERDMSTPPLFQVMFDVGTESNVSKLQLGELEIFPETFPHNTAKFDLSFSIAQTDLGLKGFVVYNTDLYNEETINKLMAHYKELLSSLVKEPWQQVGKLPMLLPKEVHQLLHQFNDTFVAYPHDKTIIDLFHEQVIKTPDKIAVVFEQDQLTYKQLNERANQVSHYLKSKGLKGEMLVPICMGQSMEMIVAILGIQKAGGAYVPIDPEYPEERMDYILKDTNAKIVVSSKRSYSKLQASASVEVIEIDEDWSVINMQPAENLLTDVQPHHLAYIIYTSGSTGRPKGVMIEHKSIVHYLTNSKTSYINEKQNGSGSFIHLSYTFDASLTA